MAWIKNKIVVVVGASLLMGIGVTIIVVRKQLSSLKDEPHLSKVSELVSPAMEESFWKATSENLKTAPQAVIIRPTQFPTNRALVKSGESWLGNNCSTDNLLRMAWGASEVRTILPPNLPKEHFDILINVPTGGQDAFKAEIRKKFGLTGRRETRQMDSLLLKVKTPGASGLKISQERKSSNSAGGSRFSMKNQSIGSLASRLEYVTRQPVINQTGLTDKKMSLCTGSKAISNL